MTRPPFDSEPGELLRRLAQENLPSQPEDAGLERRERLVRSMKDALQRSAESRERASKLRRAVVWVAAAAIVLVTGVFWKERERGGSGPIAGLDGVSGTVVLTQDGTGRVVGAGERTLRDGDSLQTAAGARAHVATSKSSVNVSESTELRFMRPSPAEERISLRRGRVDVSVDKKIETTRAVVIETPDAEVVVRGTVFDVRVEPLRSATSTHVHVTRGSVWVLAQGVQVALLSAGQSWSSTGGVEGAAVATPPSAAPSSVEKAAAPPSAPAVSGGSESRHVAATPDKASKNSASAREVSERRNGTLAEENKLFSAGIEARNRGDVARAAELFGELLATYPKSTLREVAQVERFRALSRAGQATRAVSEARHYLAEHPDGAARSEARDLALGSQK